MAIGKVGSNGTLNENGAFYSVQDVNTLLENVSSGGDLPTPTVEDVGKAVVVGDDGKYTLGEGGGDNLFIVTIDESGDNLVADKTFAEILTALQAGKIIIYSFSGFNVLGNNITETGNTITSIGGCAVSVIGGEGATTVLAASELIIHSDNTIDLLEYTSE